VIGLELSISVLRFAIAQEPTGDSRAMRGTVASVAKRHAKQVVVLDGEEGNTVWGKVLPVVRSRGALPIGLPPGMPITRYVTAGTMWTLTVKDLAGAPGGSEYHERYVGAWQAASKKFSGVGALRALQLIASQLIAWAESAGFN
jgi:Predicted homoserine dehydrogenase